MVLHWRPMSTPELLVVLCNFPDPETAARIARQLVEERVCACVNLLPTVRSLYHWQGSIEEAAETPALIKTTRDRYSALEARLRALHPYQVPEVVALPAAAVSDSYLRWVSDETR